MCQGHFIADDKLITPGVTTGNQGGGNSNHGQIALGSENGAVYIFHNFNVS